MNTKGLVRLRYTSWSVTSSLLLLLPPPSNKSGIDNNPVSSSGNPDQMLILLRFGIQKKPETLGRMPVGGVVEILGIICAVFFVCAGPTKQFLDVKLLNFKHLNNMLRDSSQGKCEITHFGTDTKYIVCVSIKTWRI